MPDVRVLIVEDEIIVARGLEARLHELGYEVSACVSSGEEAIRKAIETEPDLVLMDIHLQTEMDGIEAAEEIHRHIDLPVIYLTAHTDDVTLERAKITAPFGYILKPVEVRELHSTIEMALFRRTLEKRLQESEERYRIVSGLTSDFAYAVRVDPDGGLDLEWAPETFPGSAELGFDEPQVVDDWARFIHPDDIAAALAAVERVLSGQTEEIEVRIVIGEGQTRWLRIHGRPLWDGAQGRVVRIIGAVRDITAHQRAEKELALYREHLEELVETRTAELMAANNRLLSEITERVHAQEAQRRRAEELIALNNLSRRVSASLSLDQVIEASMQEIAAHVRPDLAMLYLAGDSGDEIRLQAIHPRVPEFVSPDVKIRRVGQCLCGLAARERQPVYSRDIQTDPRCTRDECKQTGMASFGALPLLKGDHILGVLGIGSATGRDFGERAAFLEALTGEIAIGLQNALLYQQMQSNAADLEREVTERRRIGEALRESEQRYRLLVEHAPAGIYEIDISTGRFSSVNEVMCAYTGYTREELLSLNPMDLLTEESQQRFFERQAKALAGEPIPETVEYQLNGKDGPGPWNLKRACQRELPPSSMTSPSAGRRKKPCGDLSNCWGRPLPACATPPLSSTPTRRKSSIAIPPPPRSLATAARRCWAGRPPFCTPAKLPWKNSGDTCIAP